ncbi:MAG TPA: dockerin type I domain-containing protein [Acidobacteriota bacterium]|nr:dockerin type I domain-containing protein [Acidobacteriota bacterium]
MKARVILIALCVVVLLALGTAADPQQPQRAEPTATFTVTSTADDGTAGTLRWAINSANSTTGSDMINFAIPGTGPHYIYPINQLPPLTDPAGVAINGLTQTGASLGTTPPSTVVLKIVINGSNAGPAHGLWVQSNNNLIIALGIEAFEYDGIRIEGIMEASSNIVQGCFIGTDVTGYADKGNGRATSSLWAGVHILNQPGGTAVQNIVNYSLISGNWSDGVWIEGPKQPGDVGFNSVHDCYIGTDIRGNSAIQNDHEGVCLCEGAHDNLIQDNVISGNGWDGVGIQGYSNEQYPAPPIHSHSNSITRNLIGLDVNRNPLGNGMHGVAIGEYGPGQFGFAPSNTVDLNEIAYNGTDGVAVWEDLYDNTNCDGNKITQNSIHNNGGLGIDLQNDGVTLNDPGDLDDKGNEEMNFPVITGASFSGGTTTITGTYEASMTTVEVFKAQLDPTGYGEGEIYLGDAVLDGGGGWTLSTTALAAGDFVTATATDGANNTSEFCADVQVTSSVVDWDCIDNPPDGKTAGGDETEPNDQCTDADYAACETAYCGDITDGDEDWWVVTLPEDACYCLHVRVFGDDTPNQYAYGGGLNPALTVYADDCTTQLFSNLDHNGTFPDAEGQDSQYDCQDPGNCYLPGTTLYLKITSEQATHGPYLLVINCDICECPEEPADTCEYYKGPYEDYAPVGMPDFDQKQDAWTSPVTGGWSHCGPVALANCFWWFDSKFEPDPVDPTPFYPGPGYPAPNDGYSLVQSYEVQGAWDDHDTNNVMPFVDSLALYCNTNPPGTGRSGTNIFDLEQGARDWLTKTGLTSLFTIEVFPVDDVTDHGFEYIREEVLRSQDVILLIGFYEEFPGEPPYCERIGGHYVTVAGTCTDVIDSALCISDPFFDNNEAVAHAASLHNDAALVSGPHGTIHHDRYDVGVVNCMMMVPPLFQLELLGYPVNPVNVVPFIGMNDINDMTPMDPTGAPIHAIIEYAVVICPVDLPPEPTLGKVKHNIDGYKPGDGNPVGTYWNELWPNFNEPWQLTSWVDNGDGVLSYCDTIDFTHTATGMKIWEHVEKVTPTIGLNEPTGGPVIYYLEALDPNPNIDPITDPVGSWWHEVWPIYCTPWKITDWTDNGNGYLDYGDNVVITPMQGDPVGLLVYEVQTDIITTPLPTPGDEYDHNLDGYLPSDGNPTDRVWHELWPNYCDLWYVAEWRDNGDKILSFCDTLKFASQQIPDSVIWKHVEEVTLTVKLAFGEDTTYMDYMCGNPMAAPIGSPVIFTYWLQVYPHTLTRYMATGWGDNGSGVLDSCDNLGLMAIDGPDSGTVTMYHVEGTQTDIVTTYVDMEPEVDTCDYYKSPYEDYAPNGMPDFDQKQDAWVDVPGGKWTHCGPVALANCFWWFDSKFEPDPVDPTPFWPGPGNPPANDGYPLVTSYDPTGGWDDHDTNNVMPFIDSLAAYCSTNLMGGPWGTFIYDLADGANNWLIAHGLDQEYTITLVPNPTYPDIQEQVLMSQDVILLLGFWQLDSPEPGQCCRFGGHYVTVAGVCRTDPAICISDPFYNMQEGEPPVGSSHGASLHNDAWYVSAPHGTIHHDKYYVGPPLMPCPMAAPPALEVYGYPTVLPDILTFYNQNAVDPGTPMCPLQTGEFQTLVEYAIVICPADTCAGQLPGDANTDGVINSDDITFLTDLFENDGPDPNPKANGDPNGDCLVNYADIDFLTTYLYLGGPEPVECTCVDPRITCCYQLTGNIDCDAAEIVDIGDLTALIRYLFIPPIPTLCCPEEANVDGDAAGIIDIGDLTGLIAYLFISPNPLPEHCL